MPVPEWLSRGTPVADIYARSGDAEFIIDSDFAEDRNVQLGELVWMDSLVPTAAFGLQATLVDHINLVRGQSTVEACARLDKIRAWARERGGIERALRESPLLLTLRNGKVTLEDGWHRLGIAVFEGGLTQVPALCAALPSTGRQPPAAMPHRGHHTRHPAQ